MRACGLRAAGDLGDPASAVSSLVAERGGVALMPELGYEPNNRYLPPRARTDRAPKIAAQALETASPEGGFLGWVDRILSR